MSDEIFFDGVRYISAAEAAEDSGFTRDYVAKLCRDGKVVGRRVGKNWYANHASLRAFLVAQESSKNRRRESLIEERTREYHHLDTFASAATPVASPITVRAVAAETAAPVVVPVVREIAHVTPPTPVTAAQISSPKFSNIPVTMSSHVAAMREKVSGTAVKHGSFVADTARDFSSHAGLTDAALRVAHIPVYSVTPFAEFVHKLVALTLAFMLTFGTYALVDPTYAKFAMESVSQNIHSVADAYRRATHGGIGNLADDTQANVKLAVENPGASLASAASFFPSKIADVARAFNAQVDGLVYAVAFPEDLIQKHLAGLNGGGSVAVQIQPYASHGIGIHAAGSQTEDASVDSGALAIARYENGLRVPTMTDGGAPAASHASSKGGVTKPSALNTLNTQSGVTAQASLAPVSRDMTEEALASAGGISESYLDTRLNELSNKLSSQMYALSSANSTAITQNYQVSAQSNAVDSLIRATIDDSKITGGSINGAQINNATSLSVTGDTTLSNVTVNGSLSLSSTSSALTATNAVITNATTTNFAATGLTQLATTTVSGDLTLGGSLNFSSSSSTISATGAIFVSATSTNFFATTASSTNLFATTAAFGALNISGLSTFANGFVSQASSTVAGDFTVTGNTILGNATTSNLITNDVHSNGNTFVVSGGSVGIGTSNIGGYKFEVAGGARISGALDVANVVATSSSAVSLFNGDLAVNGNSTFSNATSTNFFASVASSTNLYAQNANIGILDAGTLNLSGLATFANGFVSQASSTVNGAFTATGNSTFANATSTNFFATTASSTNLFATTANFGNLNAAGFTANGNGYFSGGVGIGIATSAPGVLQTQSNAYIGGNLFVAGDSTVIGNSTSNTITINSAVNSNIVPNGNKIYDLGSPSFFWRNGYLDNLTVNNISAASTSIGGTASNSFTLNSDNNTADTEDMQLIFFRGTVVPNAVFSWNSASNAKRFELNQSTFISNQSGSTTQPTLALQGVAGQTGNIFQIASSSGSTIFAIGPDGTATLGNTALGTTTVTNLTVTNTNNSSFAGGLTVGGNATTTGNAVLSGSLNIGSGSLIVSNTGNLTFGAGIKTFTAPSGLTFNSATNNNAGGIFSLTSNITSSSNNTQLVSIAPTISETGSAGYTGLLVNPTESTVGSGAKNIADFQLGGVSKLVILDNGNVGVGTSTPFGKFAINLNQGETNALAFNIASSTGAATTTLFSVSNTGSVLIGNGASAFLQIGGTTSSFPGLTNNGSQLFVKKADNSNYADLGASNIYANGTLFGIGANGTYTWTNTNFNGQATADTGLSRLSGGVVGFGTGAQGSTAGGFIAASSTIVGNFTTTGNLAVTGTTGTSTIAAGQGFTIGGSQFLVQQGSGFVGIGTASPRQALEVNGAISVGSAGIGTNGAGGASGGLFFSGTTLGLEGSGSSGSVEIGNSSNASKFAWFDGTSGNLGIGTTTPWAKLSIKGTNTSSNTNSFLLTDSADNSLFALDNGGNVTIASTTATTTIAGGLNVNNGALTVSAGGGYTAIQNLQLGALTFDSDAGQVSLADLPVTSASPSGTQESYTAQIGGQSVLTVSGLSNGSGGVTNLGVAIGTSSPWGMLSLFGADNSASTQSFGIANAASSTLFGVFNNGNVGIATSSPTQNAGFSVGTTTYFTSSIGIGTTTPGAGASFGVSGGSYLNGAVTITGGTTFTNATTTTFFATTASSTNLFSQTASLGALTANSLTVNGLSNFTGLTTHAAGFISQASSTVVGNFTTTGAIQGNSTITSGSDIAVGGGEFRLYDTAAHAQAGCCTGRVFRISSGVNGGGLFTNANGIYAWTGTISTGSNDAANIADTAISRLSAGVVGFGTGAAASTAGGFLAASSTILGNFTATGTFTTGTTTINGALTLANGAQTIPSLNFSGSTNTGLYYDAGNTQLDFTFGGSRQQVFGAQGQITGSSFSSNSAGTAAGGNFRFQNGSSLFQPNGLSDIGVAVNSAEIARFTTAGVGIGTSTPWSKLTINSSVTTGNAFEITNSTGSTTRALFTNSGQFQVGDGIGGSSAIFSVDASSSTTTISNLSVGNINFDQDAGMVALANLPLSSTPAAGTIESQSIIIGDTPILTAYAENDGATNLSQNGKVGVGTTTPWGRLSVSSIDNASNPQFVVASSTATSLFVGANGNVGIGTANPAVNLEIVSPGTTAANLNLETTANNNALFRIKTNSSIRGYFGQTTANGGTFGIFDGNTNSILSLSSGNVGLGGTAANTVPVLQVLSSGNVGIGSTTPFAKLSVGLNVGDTNTLAFNIASSTGAATTSLFSISNTGQALFSDGSVSAPAIGFTGQTNTGFYRSSTSVVALTLGGTSRVEFNSDDVTLRSGGSFRWSVGGIGQTVDTNLSRLSAGVIGFGTGAGASTAGGFLAASSTILGNFTTTGTGTFGTGGILSSSVTLDLGGDVANATTWGGRAAVIGGGVSGVRLPAANVFAWSPSTDTRTAADTALSRLSAGKLGVGTGASGSTAGTLIAGAIGVGTSTPYSLLTLWGTNTTSGSQAFNVTNSASTTNFAIDNAGFISAGASQSGTPSGIFTIDASSSTTTISNLALGNLVFDTDAGNVNLSDIPVDSNAASGVQQSQAINIGGTPVLTVSGISNGSGGVTNLGVGIGTTTPWGALALSSSAQQDGNLPLFNVASTTNASIFAINGNGNVGIGTAVPTAQFQLKDPAATNQLLSISSPNAGSQYKISTAFSDLNIGTNNSSTNLLFTTAGVERARFDTNGNFGIGTTSPYGKFAIALNQGETNTLAFNIASSTGAATTSLFSISNAGTVTQGAGQYLAQLGSVTAPSYSFAGNTNTGIYNVGGTETAFTSASTWLGGFDSQNTSYLIINQTRGIGFSSAATQNANAGISRTANATIAVGNGSAGDISGTLLASKIGIGTTTPWGALAISTSAQQDGNIPLFNVASTSGAAIFAINGNGNVGIATTSPSSVFSINNVANFYSGATSSIYGALQTQNIIPAGPYTTNLSNFDLGATGSRFKAVWAGTVNVGTSTFSLQADANSNLGFYTAASGGGSEALTIGSNGNVGVGTTSPGQALSINGAVYATGGIKFADGSVQTAAAAAGASGLAGQAAFYAANGSTISATSSLFIASSGNVGIGTSSPLSLLHVQSPNSTAPVFTLGSTISSFATQQTDATISLGTVWGPNNTYYQAAGISGIHEASGDSNFGALAFSTRNAGTVGEKLRITSAGNVGIGTSTPGDLLSVAKDQNGYTVGRLSNSNTGSGAGTALAFNTDAGLVGDIFVDNTTNTSHGGANSLNIGNINGTGNIAFFTAGQFATPRLLINSTGNVGIGTSSPSSNLEVSGTQADTLSSGTSANGMLRIGQATAGGSRLLDFGVGASGAWLQSRDRNSYATTYNLSLNPTGGNVGIGSSTPATTFSVGGSGYFTGGLGVGVLNTVAGTANISGATTLGGALTYGGVTLANSVQGTGSMVLSASPTLSGTIGGNLTFSGTHTLQGALTYGGVTLANAVTGTGNMVLSASPTLTGTLTAAAANFSGNVGIGTTTPGATLHVFPGSSDAIWFGTGTLSYPTAPTAHNGIVSRGGTADARLMVQDGNGRINDYWNAYTDAGGYKYMVSSEPADRSLMSVNGTTGADFAWYTAPAGTAGSAITWTQMADMNGQSDIWLSPRGTNSDFYITNSGKVGIGNTNPQNYLSVLNGTANTTGDDLTIPTASVTGPNWAMNGSSSNGTFMVATNDAAAIDVGGSVAFGGRYNGTAQATWSAIKGAKDDNTAGNFGGYLSFGTRANGSQISEKMRLTGAGNLGIGSSTPLRIFTVASASGNPQASIAYDAARTTELQTNSSGDFIINPTGGNVRENDTNMWVCAGGSCPAGTPTGKGNLIVETDIGIGNSAPTQALDIVGNETLTGSLTLSTANASISNPSWINVPGGMYFSSGPIYTEATIHARGGIDNDTAAVLSVKGGTGSITNIVGSLGVGSTSPAQSLGVANQIYVGSTAGMGHATSTFQGDIKITGKLDVGTIDPVYTIDGVKYATYGASSVGVHEETLQTIELTDKDSTGKYAYTISFDDLDRGSDLWLFWQVTDFGAAWKNLVISLTPSFDGTVFYKKVPGEHKLIVYADQPGEVSMRLSGLRFDFSKWQDVRPDQKDKNYQGFQINSKPGAEAAAAAGAEPTGDARLAK